MCINHISTCTKAIEVTNIKREAKPVYSKIHSLIENIVEPTAYAVVLDNDRLRDLPEEFLKKQREEKKGKIRKLKCTMMLKW